MVRLAVLLLAALQLFRFSVAQTDPTKNCTLKDNNQVWYCPRSAPSNSGSVRQLCSSCTENYGNQRYLWLSSSRQGVIDQKACTRVSGKLYCQIRYQCERCSSTYLPEHRYLLASDEAYYWDQSTCSSFSNTTSPQRVNPTNESTLFCFRYLKETTPTEQVGMTPGIQSCACEPLCTADGTATYMVTITHSWNTTVYQRPSGPHWSPVVMTSHSSCGMIWRNGTIATNGIEVMAETGATGTLTSEINALGDQRLQWVRGTLINSATGTNRLSLNLDANHPLVSATSMIAPSPDWFVGVDSIPLCSGSQWIDSVTYNLFPWDAGSDSGLTYRASNQNTNPKQTIMRIRPTTTSRATNLFVSTSSDASFPMSTITFERTSMDPNGTMKNAVCNMCTGMTLTSCHRSYDIVADTRAGMAFPGSSASGILPHQLLVTLAGLFILLQAL